MPPVLHLSGPPHPVLEGVRPQLPLVERLFGLLPEVGDVSQDGSGGGENVVHCPFRLRVVGCVDLLQRCGVGGDQRSALGCLGLMRRPFGVASRKRKVAIDLREYGIEFRLELTTNALSSIIETTSKMKTSIYKA